MRTEPVPSDKLLDAALRLTEQARYAEAEAAFGNALAEAERANGDRGGQARVANEMAGLLCARGDLPHAEELYQRVIAIWQGLKDNRNLAWALSSLASLYADEGKSERVRALVDRALSLTPQNGPNDVTVALTLENLGHVAMETGSYGLAESMYMRAIAIRRRVTADDPSQAKPLATLGYVYYVLGRYPEAEDLYLRAVSIREKALGTDHPDAAKVRVYLAELYVRENQYGKAEKLAEAGPFVSTASVRAGPPPSVSSDALSSHCLFR